jgi:hypothetical protein
MPAQMDGEVQVQVALAQMNRPFRRLPRFLPRFLTPRHATLRRVSLRHTALPYTAPRYLTVIDGPL